MGRKAEARRLLSFPRRRQMEQQPTYVGLDIHKNTIVATAVDSQGRRIDPSKLTSSDHDLREYLRALPGDKRVVMEACTFWEHSFDAAASVSSSVVLSLMSKSAGGASVPL